MSFFSERMKFRAPRSVIQRDSVDDGLKNGLWSLLTIYYWTTPSIRYDVLSEDPHLHELLTHLWLSYFKHPIDTLPRVWSEALRGVRAYFFASQRMWYELYDLTEFVANSPIPMYQQRNERFRRECNELLKRELSAYRFVGANWSRSPPTRKSPRWKEPFPFRAH